MLEHTDTWLTDRAWRRERLEEALWDPELPYARKRLGSYGLEVGGWDLLPEIEDRVEPVSPTTMAQPFVGEPLLTEQPQTEAEWRALGERAFWTMPMRRDAYAEWLVTRPDLWDAVGLQKDAEGNLRGLVRFRDARGQTRVGITCALCHGNQGRAGEANRTLNLGLARALYIEEYLGREPGVYAHWGAGRVDVTDDDIDDPLAIQDLWGVPWLSHLNNSGGIRNVSPASLAVRFETQFIVGHALEARPNRTLIWALTLYLLTFERPNPEPDMGSRGASLFAQRCASCHNPERGYSGGLVEAELLTSDPTAAFSPLRGTGSYKTPSLLGVGHGGPYLHDGTVPNLAALLDQGHPFGEPIQGQ
ncbi:MAG: hypothetical protein AAFS10_25720, partial [Myxococcota bacterium]